MSHNKTTHPLMEHAFQARSIAIIGASESSNSVGGRPLHYMTRFGYRGTIFPVNPKREQVQGLKCFPSLDALPISPEMVIIAVSARRASEAIQACAQQGVRSVVMMSSGFSETGDAGRQAEQELVAIAQEAGIRLIGPNSQGITNFRDGVVANFSTMFMEVPPQDGNIAIIGQSGAASVMPYALLRERGLGVRYLAATGNDADVTSADLIEAVLEDPDIRLVLLYLESIKDARSLARAAERAREQGVAIVALKSGTSRKGQSAASSHTGALATEDAVVDAFFRRHAIWRVRDIQDLAAASELYLSNVSLGRGRMLTMSHSGAVGVICADAAERLGVVLPDLSDTTVQRLREIMPAFGAIHNPLDLTAGLLSDGALFGKALDVLCADPRLDIIHIGMPVAGEGYDVEGFARAARDASERNGKMVIVSGPQRAILSHFAAQSLLTFQSDTEVIRQVHQVVHHRRLMQQAPPLIDEAPLALHISASDGGMDEAASLGLLNAMGLPVVDHHVCHGTEQAREAFQRLGGICVLKACTSAIPHKSEHGLVWLNLDSETAVQAAYGDCHTRLEEMGIDGTVIVARQESGLHEIALGGRQDPVLGPVVLVGDGGKYVEAVKDYQLLVPPFTAAEVREALQKTRIWPILEGVRGEPPADIGALCDAAVLLGNTLAVTPTLDEIDLNPVLIKPAGQGAVIVDALISVKATADTNDTPMLHHQEASA